MAEYGESGGVRALRAWADEAAERAARLVGQGGEGSPVSAEEFESSIAELSRLRPLLDHDPELLGRVTLVLGGLLATRHATGRGTPGDPERARRLLEEVRDRTTAAGERMAEDGRRWAATFLMMVSGHTEPGRPAGSPPDFWSVFDRAMAAGPEGAAEEAARMAALAAEVGQLPVPPELQARLGQMREVLAYMSKTDLSDPETLLAMLPPDLPFGDQLRTMLDLVATLPDTADTAGSADPAESAEPCVLPVPEAVCQEPQSQSQSQSEADTTVTSAWLAAVLGLPDALQTGDPESLNRLLQRLGGQLDRLPTGHGRASEIENLMRMVLQTAGPLGGSRADSGEAHGQIASIAEHFAQWTAGDPRGAELNVGVRAHELFTRMAAEEEAENEEEYLRLVGEVEALERETPPEHTFRWLVELVHGTTLTAMADRTGDSAMLVRGLARQEAALASVLATEPWVPQEQIVALREALRAAQAALGDTPDLMPDPAPPAPGAATGTRYLAALTATLRHSTTQDPADLDAAISGLEQVRDDIRQGRAPQLAAPALWQLAENYRRRLDRTRDQADRDAATDAAMESLQALAGDVVLQAGSDHGLLAARSGADRGVRAAIWAASQGRVEDAVAALELGRALVLRAASTSRAVPELLESRGHHDLAGEWRVAERGRDGAGPGAEAVSGAAPDTVPWELPSSLRRRALDALGRREPGGVLFSTPTVDELKAGVAEGNADALVYLLAGGGGTPGMAVVVGPDIGTGVRALPLLSAEQSGPLERYLDAAAAHQERPGVPAAAQTWEDALSDLCDWATDAVVLPVISGIVERLAENENRRKDRPGPPRIVLVPCGRLGIVPWHAARLPAEAPSDYVCQIMVISYAASGRQFLNTVRRARRAPADAPVLVSDPTMSLPYAELEVTALQQSLYPRARLYGEFYEPPAEPAAAGTPGDLLDALAGAPSLLHVACHGSAGPNPTTSALRLAPDGDGPEEGRPTDLLTVTRLLDRPMGEQEAPDGPLVVLSACETDLSKRDHDEALTLTTAFVASGARDVVGSRWATRDSAAALMMAVFHHYVTVEGLSPVDALHVAQKWMLDPERQNPGSLSGSLLDELTRGPDLRRPATWAAFIHQGHPGPSTTG
ncbi:CHAT domain-containing protein [Streptomyces sp. NBC_00190]|uniref:CHAT domain-containing protein n=1 Tax=unclassified Streptomyces TaxID=2593676 RepID=UPI002E2AA891|nr:CHAT domain-containing protein [Streptomyces sp. NBC_00190]